MKHEKISDALACFEKAVNLDPNLLAAWIDRGTCCKKLERYAEAEIYYETAIRISPKSADAWRKRGDNYFLSERYDHAYLCFQKAIEYEPEYAINWYNQAITQEKLNRKTEAIQSFVRFLEHASPGDEKFISYSRQRLQAINNSENSS